ncbi:MAG: HEAT repeat domain-containing protein [Anaerolineae bacterium]|nr:HEAT repeat domain-containing protein [Anaerolineae bacterium]
MNRPKILSTLNIRPGEGRLVSWMLIYAMFMGIPALITETAAYSLLLESFSAQIIPYIYIGFAIVTTLSGLAYTTLEKRITFVRFVSINLFILAVVPFGFRFILQVTDTPWVLPGLAVWYEVSWALANLGFWSMAVHLFDLRQGKRLFGLIGIGLTLSEATAGFMVPVFVRLVGTANLLVVTSASFLGALLVQTYILRFAVPTTDAEPEETPDIQADQSLLDLFKNNYVVLIFALAGLYALSFYALDNAFYDQVEINFPNADDLASFLGFFFGLSSLLTLILGAFVSGRVISRYGLYWGLLLMPVTILIGVTLTAGVGTLFEAAVALFWLVVVIRFLNEILAYTINRAAWQVLYEPLPERLRLRAQTVVESMVKPTAGGVAGLLLIGLSAAFGFSTLQIMYLLIGVLIAWIGVVIWINRLYPTVLLQALAKRRLVETTIDINQTHIGIFKAGLRSSHVGVVNYSLAKLEELAPQSMPQFLQELLTHPAAEIRLAALERIEALALTAALPAVKQLADTDPEAKVRGVALRTLARLGGETVLDELCDALASDNFQIRLGAMTGLLRQLEPIGPRYAAVKDKLIGWANSPQLDERILAAQVMGEAAPADLNPLLLKLLADDNVAVREAALLATKRLYDPTIWDAVIQSLNTPHVRRTALAALAAAGEKIIPQLETALATHEPHKEMFVQLIQICGRIRSSQAGALLIKYLDFPDVQVRTEILTALGHCHYQAAESERPMIIQSIRTEVAQATWVLAALVNLADDTRLSLLETALQQELVRYRRRLFWLLSFIYLRPTILSAQAILDTDALLPETVWDKQKTYALEIIDITLSSELKALVLPLLDNLTLQQRLAQLEAIFPQPPGSRDRYLYEIITATADRLYPWTRAAALHLAAKLGLAELASAAAKAANTSDKLVRNSALFTAQNLDPAAYATVVKNGRGGPQRHNGYPSVNEEKKMLSLVERILLLKSVAIFAETPEEVLAEVAVVMEEVRAKAGELIIEKGSLGSSLFIIIDGQVNVHDEGRVIAKLGESEVFGEFSLLDPGPRTATVTALEESRLFRLDQDAFLELLDDHSTIARKIIQVLVRYLRNAHFQMNTLAYQDISLPPPGK